MANRIVSTILLSCLLPFSASIASAGNEDDETMRTVSPDAIVQNGLEWQNQKEVVVKFEVGSVMVVPTIFPDESKQDILHLVPSNVNGDFTVPLSRDVQAMLTRIGIDDIPGHFVGKTVTLKGCVSGTVLGLIGSPSHWTYHVQLRSIKNFVSVKSASKNRKYN